MILPKGLSLNSEGKLTSTLVVYGESYYVKQITNHFFEVYQPLTVGDMSDLATFCIEKGLKLEQIAHRVSNKNFLDSVKIAPNFPGISTLELARIIHLYEHYSDRNLEVGVLFYYNPDLNVIKAVLPTQTVIGGHWDWDLTKSKWDVTLQKMVQTELPLKFLDPSFGVSEEITESWLKANNWHQIGTSHSHHTMTCTWSGCVRDKLHNNQFRNDDYSSQAGSKENPMGNKLHMLIYSMKKQDHTDSMPSFQILISVNNQGELYDFYHSQSSEGRPEVGQFQDFFFVDEDSQLTYEDVDWIGGEMAETLAKKVIQPALPAAYKSIAKQGTYSSYNHWYQNKYDHNHDKLSDARIYANFFSNQSQHRGTVSIAELEEVKQIALDLLLMLAPDDQVDLIDQVLDSWIVNRPEEFDTSASIALYLIQHCAELKEGLLDLEGMADFEFEDDDTTLTQLTWID